MRQRTAAAEALPDDGSVLYKYRDLEGKGFQRVWSILSDSRIYLPSAAMFNDPFDMKIRFEVRANESEMKKYFNDLFRRKKPNLSQSQRKVEVQRAIGRFREPGMMAELAADMQKRIHDKLGVLSLSDDPTQILMWSHYSGSHTGICIGFEASDPLFAQAIKVTYQQDFYVANAIGRDLDEQASQILTTKASFWSYERERRVVDHVGGPGMHEFGSNAIRTVILGSRIPNEYAKAVIAWSRNRGSAVRILRARESERKFALEFFEEDV